MMSVRRVLIPDISLTSTVQVSHCSQAPWQRDSVLVTSSKWQISAKLRKGCLQGGQGHCDPSWNDISWSRGKPLATYLGFIDLTPLKWLGLFDCTVHYCSSLDYYFDYAIINKLTSGSSTSPKPCPSYQLRAGLNIVATSDISYYFLHRHSSIP